MPFDELDATNLLRGVIRLGPYPQPSRITDWEQLLYIHEIELRKLRAEIEELKRQLKPAMNVSLPNPISE